MVRLGRTVKGAAMADLGIWAVLLGVSVVAFIVIPLLIATLQKSRRNRTVRSLRRGDRVRTMTGIVGTVLNIEPLSKKEWRIELDASGNPMTVSSSVIVKKIGHDAELDAADAAQTSVNSVIPQSDTVPESVLTVTAQSDAATPSVNATKARPKRQAARGRTRIGAKSIVGFVVCALAYIQLIVINVLNFMDRLGNLSYLYPVSFLIFAVIGSLAFFILRTETDLLSTIGFVAAFFPAVLLLFLINVVIFIINAIRQADDIQYINFKKNGNAVDCTVYDEDSCDWRQLKYCQQTTDYTGYGVNPYYGQPYRQYIDDHAYYWRSYDGGQTFLKTGTNDTL